MDAHFLLDSPLYAKYIVPDRKKSQFLVPNFQPNFFRSSKFGLSRAMPRDAGLYAIFSNGGEPALRLKTAILDLGSQFFGRFESLSGSSGFVL